MLKVTVTDGVSGQVLFAREVDDGEAAADLLAVLEDEISDSPALKVAVVGAPTHADWDGATADSGVSAHCS